MMTKKIILLIFSLILFSQRPSFAFNHNCSMELIIDHQSEYEGRYRQLTINIYNGYELVESKITQEHAPTSFHLNLYCNYIVTVEQNGMVIKRYKVNTEVPQKERRDWKYAISLTIGQLIDNKQLAIEYPTTSISFNIDHKKFICNEVVYPKVDQENDASLNLAAKKEFN